MGVSSDQLASANNLFGSEDKFLGKKLLHTITISHGSEKFGFCC